MSNKLTNHTEGLAPYQEEHKILAPYIKWSKVRQGPSSITKLTPPDVHDQGWTWFKSPPGFTVQQFVTVAHTYLKNLLVAAHMVVVQQNTWTAEANSHDNHKCSISLDSFSVPAQKLFDYLII